MEPACRTRKPVPCSATCASTEQLIYPAPLCPKPPTTTAVSMSRPSRATPAVPARSGGPFRPRLAGSQRRQRPSHHGALPPPSFSRGHRNKDQGQDSCSLELGILLVACVCASVGRLLPRPSLIGVPYTHPSAPALLGLPPARLGLPTCGCAGTQNCMETWLVSGQRM